MRTVSLVSLLSAILAIPWYSTPGLGSRRENKSIKALTRIVDITGLGLNIGPKRVLSPYKKSGFCHPIKKDPYGIGPIGRVAEISVSATNLLFYVVTKPRRTPDLLGSRGWPRSDRARKETVEPVTESNS
jgi:hypothetical protein